MPDPAAARTEGPDARSDASNDGHDTQIAQLGYEQARDALMDVVRRLEGGNLTLEESLALWERGEELAEVCRQRLEGARARLAKVTGEGSAGGPGAPDLG